MAGVADVLTTIQNGVVALNDLGLQVKGSLLNISSQLTVLNARTIKVVATQVFAASGTYTPTPGMVYCIIEAVGGGSGGAGITGPGAALAEASPGGGAGAYSRSLASAATIGGSQVVTIGAAGTGGTAGSNPGGAGGTTSVGTICI